MWWAFIDSPEACEARPEPCGMDDVGVGQDHPAFDDGAPGFNACRDLQLTILQNRALILDAEAWQAKRASFVSECCETHDVQEDVAGLGGHGLPSHSVVPSPVILRVGS